MRATAQVSPESSKNPELNRPRMQDKKQAMQNAQSPLANSP